MSNMLPLSRFAQVVIEGKLRLRPLKIDPQGRFGAVKKGKAYVIDILEQCEPGGEWAYARMTNEEMTSARSVRNVDVGVDGKATQLESSPEDAAAIIAAFKSAPKPEPEQAKPADPTEALKALLADFITKL
jgi:hypothetical protein